MQTLLQHKSFAAWLAATRAGLRLSQAQFAAALGYTRQYYGLVEHGTAPPTAAFVAALQTYLGANVPAFSPDPAPIPALPVLVLLETSRTFVPHAPALARRYLAAATVAATTPPERAAVQLAAGELALACQDYPAAETALSGAVAAYAALPDVEGHTRALAALGDCLRTQEQYPRASAVLAGASARLLAIPAPDPALQARIAHAAGWCHYYEDDLPSAAHLLGHNLALCRAIGDKPLLAGALYALGLTATNRADPVAPALLTEATALYRGLGDRVGLARARNAQGIGLHSAGDLTGAGIAFAESLVLHEDRADHRGRADALRNAGWVAYAVGDLPEARRLLDSALPESAALWPGALCRAYLGWCHWAAGRKGAALGAWRAALRMSLDCGTRYPLGVAVLGFATALLLTDPARAGACLGAIHHLYMDPHRNQFPVEQAAWRAVTAAAPPVPCLAWKEAVIPLLQM